MTDHKKLLEMIENVKADDTEALEEIDVRAFCFFINETLKEWSPSDFEFNVIEHNMTHIYGNFDYKDECQQYTRSRDALKAVRPDGVKFNMQDCSEPWHKYWGWRCTAIRGLDDYEYYARELPTEELAELHAIIQAIAYERAENDKTNGSSTKGNASSTGEHGYFPQPVS